MTCGALSGFHATQSPLISRTTQNEKQGRYIFYGMMVADLDHHSLLVFQ
ncbi:hypothetical protein [Bacillus sp. JCM 19034]|nr:hypothetical protein [Bacillus sp. JCM 19034]